MSSKNIMVIIGICILVLLAIAFLFGFFSALIDSLKGKEPALQSAGNGINQSNSIPAVVESRSGQKVSKSDERIYKEALVYLEKKYSEEFIINGMSQRPMYMYDYFVISASPKNNPDLYFAVKKDKDEAISKDTYVISLLKPQVEERFLEITDKYFEDYKYLIGLSIDMNTISYIEGYLNDVTFQDIIDDNKELDFSPQICINEEYDAEKLSAYFNELFYNCNNPSILIFYVKSEYYYDLDFYKKNKGLDFESYSRNKWYTKRKYIGVPWEKYLKILEKGEYYDFTRDEHE